MKLLEVGQIVALGDNTPFEAYGAEGTLAEIVTVFEMKPQARYRIRLLAPGWPAYRRREVIAARGSLRLIRSTQMRVLKGKRSRTNGRKPWAKVPLRLVN